MTLENTKRMAVLGAAGKMGSGIALLLLQEMAVSIAKAFSSSEKQETPSLILVDTNAAGFASLLRYLKDHLKKYAERAINKLRAWYVSRTDLIDNEEMIQAFINEALFHVRCATTFEECRGCQLIFEAIIENAAVKIAAFRQLNALLGPSAFYFTNTSSIPIQELEKQSGLSGRLVGFHFYNPPAVQKLIEVVFPANTDQKLQDLAYGLAKELKKTIVSSCDVAGFIGNGHFIREIQFACQMVEVLKEDMSVCEAVYAVNKVTQSVMIRPMGIFQLIDYVGIDICESIAYIMSKYLRGEDLKASLISDMVRRKILGGQNSDGSQKDGFFHYEGTQIKSIYDPTQKVYVSLTGDNWKRFDRDVLGLRQEQKLTWKALNKNMDKDQLLLRYFEELWQTRSSASQLAEKILLQSHAIAYKLVHDGVADSIDDVNTVLENGFYHLYGVDLPFRTASAHRKSAGGRS